MSKTVRISDYSYEYLKSLDGSITDNLDAVIKKISTEKYSGIKRRNLGERSLNSGRLLSLAIFREFMSKSYSQRYSLRYPFENEGIITQRYYLRYPLEEEIISNKDVSRKELIQYLENYLEEWNEEFPEFFNSINRWDGKFQKALDIRLKSFVIQKLILKKNIIIFRFNYQPQFPDGSPPPRNFFPETLLSELMKEIFGDEIIKPIITSTEGESVNYDFQLGDHFIDIKNSSMTTNKTSLENTREYASKLVKSSKSLRFYDKDLNMIIFTNGKNDVFQVSESKKAVYQLNNKLVSFYDKPVEIIDEILSFKNLKILKKDYLPNIFDYIRANIKSGEMVILMTLMKSYFLENKISSKKILGSERKILREELKELINSDNYLLDKKIANSAEWKNSFVTPLSKRNMYREGSNDNL